MQKWPISICFILLVAITISSGCTNLGSTSSAPTPTPQIVYVTVLVTPTPSPSLSQPATKYMVGDIVWKNENNYDSNLQSSQGVNIVSVKDGIYNYEYVWKDDGVSHWSRIYPNVKVETIETFENYFPRKLDHVDVSTITSSYSSKAAFDAATSGISSSGSSSSQRTTLSGNGDDVQSFTATGSGLRIFTMRHTGSSNFAIILKDGNGKYLALLVNEIGSYSGKKSETLTSGKYYLDITADGPWSVDITSV